MLRYEEDELDRISEQAGKYYIIGPGPERKSLRQMPCASVFFRILMKELHLQEMKWLKKIIAFPPDFGYHNHYNVV